VKNQEYIVGKFSHNLSFWYLYGSSNLYTGPSEHGRVLRARADPCSNALYKGWVDERVRDYCGWDYYCVCLEYNRSEY